MGDIQGTPLQRVMRRVAFEDHGFHSPCWIFTGGSNGRGYGKVSVGYEALGTKDKRSAHHVTYLAFQGYIDEGLELDHLCRVPRCVNPGHLEAVSHRENIMRGSAPGAVRAKSASITHCKRGHEYTPANTYVGTSSRGYRCRACRACAKDRRLSKAPLIPLGEEAS